MLLLDQELIEALRANTDFWPDTVQALVYTETGKDPLGKPVMSWVPGAELAARVTPTTAQEVMASGEVTTQNAVLNAPLSARGLLDGKNRVRWTKRGDLTLATPIDYDLDGDPVANTVELMVAMHRASGESR